MFLSKKTLLICIAFAALALQNTQATTRSQGDDLGAQEPQPFTNSTSAVNNNPPPISTGSGPGVDPIVGSGSGSYPGMDALVGSGSGSTTGRESIVGFNNGSGSDPDAVQLWNDDDNRTSSSNDNLPPIPAVALVHPAAFEAVDNANFS